MNPDRFDDFIRSLMAPSSRRTVVGLGLGVMLAAATPDEPAARAKGNGKHGKKRQCRPRSVSAGPPRLLGYYVGYERDVMPPGEIEWNALTHIAIGTALPNKNGTLNLGFDLGNQGTAFARDLAQRARANDVVPILMVGGAGSVSGFRAAAAPSRLASFVKNIVLAMRKLGCQGIDLDWEPIEPRDEAPVEALVRALRCALPTAVITMPVIPTTINFPAVPAVYKRVVPFLNQMSIMTYGMEGAYEGWRSWHSSALHGASENTPTSVEATVGHFRKAEIPANKLGVGIGFYGDCWSSPVTGPAQNLNGAQIVATDSEMSYTTIVRDYAPNMTSLVDAAAWVPYLSSDPNSPIGAKRCTYITYEDAVSIAAKGAWAREQGLAGVIVWTINQGHFSDQPAGNRDALLRSARLAFGA